MMQLNETRAVRGNPPKRSSAGTALRTQAPHEFWGDNVNRRWLLVAASQTCTAALAAGPQRAWCFREISA
jgi:hypothetical protein